MQKAVFNMFAKDRKELIVKSKTGTGKTLSFLLPLEYLLKHQDAPVKSGVKAIILEPTRELAL